MAQFSQIYVSSPRIYSYVANTGGLLGLFMGFSVVSLIEIIYFISLRPYCAARNRHRQQQQLTQPNDDNTVLRQDDAETPKYIWFNKSATAAKKGNDTTGSVAPTKLYRFKDSIWQMAQSANDYVKSKFTGAGEYQVQKVESKIKNQQFPYTE